MYRAVAFLIVLIYPISLLYYSFHQEMYNLKANDLAFIIIRLHKLYNHHQISVHIIYYMVRIVFDAFECYELRCMIYKL